MSTGQHQYLNALNEQEKKPESPDLESIRQLPKLVEKKKLHQKRLNQIGESFGSPNITSNSGQDELTRMSE